MAVIKSGATADQLTIDPNSKASRVTEYDSSGVELYKTPTGSYLIPISMGRQTAAIAAGSYIWAFRNGASKIIRLRRIVLITSFDGTAAASTQIYQLMRFGNATPSGGSAITIVKKKTTFGASTVADARQNPAAALTIAGVVFETVGMCIQQPRQLAPLQQLNIPLDQSNNVYELQPNEGLAINLLVVGVIGDTIAGFMEFDEV